MDNLPDLPVYSFTPTAAGMLSLIITILLPLVVAVITTRVTSGAAKFMWLLLVVSIKTTIEALIANGSDYIHFAWIPFLMNLAINIGIAIAAHFGVWKPKVAPWVQDNVGLVARDPEDETDASVYNR
jgi:hypothetical protein